LGRTPHLVAADAGFYSQANEKALEEKGVKRISIPNRNTRSEGRKQHQKQRWFKNGQRWRTGCEGRISVLKRRHGLDRCLYPGLEGMKRWVGMGVNRRQSDQHRTAPGALSGMRNENRTSLNSERPASGKITSQHPRKLRPQTRFIGNGHFCAGK
jgi:hypothetical protein